MLLLVSLSLRDGSLFYAVAVAPRSEFAACRSIFDRVISSIQLIE